MGRSTNPRKLLTANEAAQVVVAIREAEYATSAEIRVVVARHCWGDLKAKARRVFRRLGLDQTAQRNGVLFLLIVANREFLIYGDQGIHEKVGQTFWDDVRDRVIDAFGQDQFGEGIAQGVHLIGQKLCQYFPHQRNDVNELSDEIVYLN